MIIVEEWLSALSKGNVLNLAFWGASALTGLSCYGGNYLSNLEVFEIRLCV